MTEQMNRLGGWKFFAVFGQRVTQCSYFEGVRWIPGLLVMWSSERTQSFAFAANWALDLSAKKVGLQNQRGPADPCGPSVGLHTARRLMLALPWTTCHKDWYKNTVWTLRFTQMLTKQMARKLRQNISSAFIPLNCTFTFQKSLWFVLRCHENSNDMSFRVNIFASTLCARPAWGLRFHESQKQNHSAPFVEHLLEVSNVARPLKLDCQNSSVGAWLPSS